VAGGWVAGHLLARWPELAGIEVTALATSQSGVILFFLAGVLVLMADVLRRRDAWRHGRFHAVGAGVVAALSLVLVDAPVIHQPERAALVGRATAAGCLGLERRWRISWLGKAASFLLPAASLAALHWLRPSQPEFWGPVLAGEALLFSLLARSWRPAV